MNSFQKIFIFKSKYILPPMPQKPHFEFKTHLFQLWKKENQSISNQQCRQRFEDLDKQEELRLRANQKAEISAFSHNNQEWKSKYLFKNLVRQKTYEKYKNDLEAQTPSNKLKMLNELHHKEMEKCSPQQHNQFQQEYEILKQEYKNKLSQYESQYAIPPINQTKQYHYFLKNWKTNPEIKYEALSNEQLLKLQEEVKEENTKINNKWEELRKRYGYTSVEELKQDVVSQLSLQKDKKKKVKTDSRQSVEYQQ